MGTRVGHGGFARLPARVPPPLVLCDQDRSTAPTSVQVITETRERVAKLSGGNTQPRSERPDPDSSSRRSVRLVSSRGLSGRVSCSCGYEADRANSIAMRCLDLFQGLFANRTQVRVCLRKRQLNAHTAANKDRQIIHQSINASDASENPRNADGLRLLERTAPLQNLTGKPDIIQHIADFVTENAEENVAVAFRPVRITSDYLSDRLIDGLLFLDTNIFTRELDQSVWDAFSADLYHRRGMEGVVTLAKDAFLQRARQRSRSCGDPYSSEFKDKLSGLSRSQRERGVRQP
jgi:hypothetical protein